MWAYHLNHIPPKCVCRWDSNQPAQLQKLARTLKNLDIASIHIILSKQRTTKVLIRLNGCAGRSAPLLFTYVIRHIFAWPGPLVIKPFKDTAVVLCYVRYLCPQLQRSCRSILVSGFVRLCVRSSKTVHARVLKFHIWIPHGKLVNTHFFSCPNYLPFWSYYAPLKKLEWHLMHTTHYQLCMLGFWNFMYGFLMEKYLTLFFFLSKLSSFLELCPFEKIRMKSCQQGISKSILARGLKLGQLIRDFE